MTPHDDGNAAVWKSDRDVAAWLSAEQERERRRTPQRRLMADLLPFADDEPFVVLDLGAGTGAATRPVLDRYPAATAILAEYSPQMTVAGTQALEAHRGSFSYVDFDLAGGPWPAAIPDPVDAVITSMCLHHLPDVRKEQLIREVLTRLAPGGWFLDLDVVAPEDAAVEEAWRRADGRTDPASAVQPGDLTADEQRRDEVHRRHISPLDRQLAFLRKAGFDGVDVYWKRLDGVLFGGRRPIDQKRR